MAVISYKCPNCDGELIFDPNTQQYKCEYCNSLFTQTELDAMVRAESTERVDTTRKQDAWQEQASDTTETGENDATANAQGVGAAGASNTGAEQNSTANAQGVGAAGASNTGAEQNSTANAQGVGAAGASNTGARAGQNSSTNAGGSENTTGSEQASEEAVIYICPSCGAEIVTDATTAATFCYYCHNPVVLSGRLEGKFLPNKVIPFKMDRKKAEGTFLEYVSKKKFVPKGFFSKKNIEKLSGIYFPYWLYSVDLDAQVSADAKNIRTWISGREEFTETKVYDLYREGEVDLKNLPENALKKANAKLAEGVLPYQFDEMKDFNMGYLSGFFAEKRDIESATVQQKMQQEMRGHAEHAMRDTMNGYGRVSVRTSNFHAKKEEWQYVLLPVWTLTYKAKNGKIYYYSMNGQTGKVCGELPIDWKKVILTALGTFAVLFIFGLIGGRFLW